MVKCILAGGLLLMLAPSAVAQTSGLADSSGPYGQHITGSLQVDGSIKSSGGALTGPLTVTGAVTGSAGLTSAGTSTIIAGSGNSDHIVLTPTTAGAVPSITATGSDGLKITAQNAGSVFISGGSPLNVGNGFTYTVGSAAVTPQLQHNFNVAGVATGDPALVYSGGLFLLNSDTLQLPDVNQAFNGWQFEHNLAAGFTGNRHALEISLIQNGTSGNTVANGTLGYYTGILGYSVASVNDNGTGLTSSTAHGRTFSANFNAELKSGATNFFQATALELNSEIDTGASALVRDFLSISPVAGAVQGTQVDAGIWVYSAGGALLKTGILFGSGGGLNGWPIDPAGTIIGADAGGGVTATAAHGIDWSSVAFTSDSLKLPGFTVDGSGNTTAATLKLTPVAVSALPTCNTAAKGTMAAVTDATSPTYNATVTGGGAVSVPVYCNGSAWTSH